MAKPEIREPGLYKNGSRWWVRSVRGPLTSVTAARSTGTDDLKLANRIIRALATLAENRQQWDLLELAAVGELSLLDLYNNHAAGTLAALRTRLAADAVKEPNLEPLVATWYSEHLAVRVRGGDLAQSSADDYLRQVRALIPAAHPFPRSRFNEDFLKACLFLLKNERSGDLLTPSTQRRYVAAWQLFYRYARKRAPMLVNPFEDAEWLPANNSPRSIYWDWDTTSLVLCHMAGEPRKFMEMVFGSGIELGAALAQQGRHFVGGEDRVLVAPGTKNEHREDRHIFLTKWAFYSLRDHAKHVLPNAPLWSFNPLNRGREIREAFYAAQVHAKLIDAPPISASGKKRWSVVQPHRIHDARHSYCYIRLLGLDGEPRSSLKECSQNLGHGDEQMAMKVYAKANIAQRLKLIELREARQAGRAAAAAESVS